MVSAYIFMLPLAAATIAISTAQQPAGTPVSFGDTPRQESLVPPVKPEPRPQLTPEMRGDILMARKQYREAVDAYLEAKEQTAVLTNKIGIAYHQMLELDLAKKQYEKAIKLDRKYSEAINNLGTVYYAKKSYRRAISQYKKALKISPQSASIYSNLGTAHFARKKYKDAAEAYETALRLDPDVFERRSSHGVLLQERSVQERAKFHFYMAKTYAKAGVVERALLYIRKALEEGFKDREKFKEDPEFAGLQENVEFQQLMTLEPRVL
jgi:tetratricopeptide (TPR) repeat protein